jgi:hypothetical protein
VKVIAAILAAVFAVALAGTAHADPNEYLYDIRVNDDINGSDKVLLDLGYAICSDIRNGVTKEEIREVLFQVAIYAAGLSLSLYAAWRIARQRPGPGNPVAIWLPYALLFVGFATLNVLLVFAGEGA